MSDAAVELALQAMEAWMAGQDDTMDDQALVRWNRGFQDAVAHAERGPGWANLVSRAHELARRVDQRKRALEADRDALRVELNQQSLGDRALKGYGSTTR